VNAFGFHILKRSAPPYPRESGGGELQSFRSEGTNHNLLVVWGLCVGGTKYAESVITHLQLLSVSLKKQVNVFRVGEKFDPDEMVW